MSALHRRAARLEQTAAEVLGASRVRRKRVYERAPDTTPVRLASGDVLQPECKTRKRLPKILVDALAQATRYNPVAIPIAIVRERGGRALAVLDLEAFARLVGLQPHIEGEQLALGMGCG